MIPRYFARTSLKPGEQGVGHRLRRDEAACHPGAQSAGHRLRRDGV